MSSPGPSISERGGKNSPARSVVSIPPVTPVPSPPATLAGEAAQKPRTSQQLIDGGINLGKRVASEMFTISKKSVNPKKEVKIYKISPATTQQMQASASATANKKVTIQVKNTQGKIQHQTGTFVINKSSGNLSGKSTCF